MLTDERRHALRCELNEMSAAQTTYFTISQNLPSPMRAINAVMVTLVCHWRDSLAQDKEPSMTLGEAMTTAYKLVIDNKLTPTGGNCG